MNYRKMVSQYIIDHIDASNHGVELLDDREKILFTYQCFLNEYSHGIRQLGEQKALAEWLSGLPTVLTVDFTYVDILKVGEKWGILNPGSPEHKKDKFLETWFSRIATNLLRLVRKYSRIKPSELKKKCTTR